MTTPLSAFAIATAHRVGRMFFLAALVLLAGCAGLNANPRDPLEPLNRHVSDFNEGVDAIVLKPAATVYKKVVPPLVRTGVSNFFGNLSDGWSFINSALQFKFQNAAENFMRLNVNTFFGLGGILDIASELNIERHREDFGQTLGRWGVPSGPYLVLPLLGPSTLRDALAFTIDRRGDPVNYVRPASTGDSLYVLRAVDVRSNLLRIGSVIDDAALDKYSFTRDAYLQKRRSDIFDSKDSDGAEPKAEGAPAAGAAVPGQPAPPPAR
ncbi:MAG: lipoprotein precursor-like protein [Ramlibacter sp.]|nr:lipoprotein precursor-like protein [Ramlibacter sp.]